MKPNLDEISGYIHSFEKKAGFDNTSKSRLMICLKEEIKNYEKSRTSKEKRDKLIDSLILLMQISRRDKISLDKAWDDWWKKSQKYLK